MDAVRALLRAIGCEEEYAEACRNCGYDNVEYLMQMKQADLDEFASDVGMLKGHKKAFERMRLLRPTIQLAQQVAEDATAIAELHLVLRENAALRQRLSHVESRLADLEARIVDAPAPMSFVARGRGGRGGRGAGRLPANASTGHDLTEQPAVVGPSPMPTPSLPSPAARGPADGAQGSQRRPEATIYAPIG